jgi:hypothetical protein
MSALRSALAAINSRVASMCSPLIKSEARFDPRAVSAANFSFARGTSIGPTLSVPEVVPDWMENLGKYWSEWQDLNLRPPRPERGVYPLSLMRPDGDIGPILDQQAFRQNNCLKSLALPRGLEPLFSP